MSQEQYTTETEERKRGKHLDAYERGQIEALKKDGKSNRAIARAIGCSPTTIGNELKKGTQERKSNKGRAPQYKAKRGELAYEENRRKCHRGSKVKNCRSFMAWIVRQQKEKDWSFDASVGYAKKEGLFPASEMVCTKTLYNALHNGMISELTLFDMPEILTRRPRKKKQGPPAANPKGTSIDERPESVNLKTEIGHWEIDTVVGKRTGKGAVVMTLVEMVTDHYIAVRLDGKTSDEVLKGITRLREEYGSKFSEVFKSITADNGTEFTDLSSIEQYGTKVYFAHPYSSWERPKNERHNRILRRYIPKGKPIDQYTADEIEAFGDAMNSLPRRHLQYKTPSELYEQFLDEVYSA